MASTQKTQKVINNSLKKDWFFLTERPDMPPLPVWYKIKNSALSQLNKEIYGIGVPWACFWHDNKVEHYLHSREYRFAIQRASRILYSQKNLSEYLVRLEQSCAQVKIAAENFNKLSGRKFDNQQLFDRYDQVVDKYIISYIYGFLTWCTRALEYDAKTAIDKYAEALNKLDVSSDQALSILIVPSELTLYQKKDKELSKLAKDYRRLLDKPSSEKYIRHHHPDLYAAIKNFINKYYWVGFNYDGPALNFSTAVKELWQTHPKVISRVITKSDIYRVCHFTEKEKQFFRALEIISYTKDLRNVTDDYVHYCFSNFYQEVARRTGLTKSEIKFLWDEELKELLIGKIKITHGYLKKKRKFCAAIAKSKAVGLKQYYLGDQAQTCYKNVLKNSNKSLKIFSASVINGTIAASGRATGKVKIIRSVIDINKVKKGDILVTSMTSPKYMPAIFNAAALITDDGGLTCHAAIIAREIRKPCIIGTKIATSVLKDGDLVEVNAEEGVITIIKRGK
ncbi:MAG: PEP-utilizing enzyme [Patescibacteria group bacterium]